MQTNQSSSDDDENNDNSQFVSARMLLQDESDDNEEDRRQVFVPGAVEMSGALGVVPEELSVPENIVEESSPPPISSSDMTNLTKPAASFDEPSRDLTLDGDDAPEANNNHSAYDVAEVEYRANDNDNYSRDTNTVDDDVSSLEEDKRTVLEEMLEGVALSMLIFLIADIRLMSATGRIATKFETIAIESDQMRRDHSCIMAGLTKSKNYKHPGEGQSNYEYGLSPAQMMAVVLVELKKTLDADEEKDEEGDKANNRSMTDMLAPSGGAGNKKTVATETKNMHSLLKAYAQMIGADLNDTVPHVEARKSMLNLMSSNVEDEFGHGSHGGGGGGGVMGSSYFSARPGSLARHTASNTTAALHHRAQKAAAGARTTLQTVRRVSMTMITPEDVLTRQELKETTDVLFKMGAKDVGVRQSLIGAGTGRTLSSEELLKIMERAVESRVYGKLDFMAQFFREGTISHNIVKSKSRIVWVNDWYPAKDLTYAIGFEKERKRLLVVFRGAITKQDWSKAVNFKQHFRVNPIRDSYIGRGKFVDLHRGFHDYLFRPRKDTGTTKYDEIANVAHRYGMERIGPDYHLHITGHSLGAALSTVFGFFASTEERFTKNGPVKIVSYGSPMVGGQHFADAFRQQERAGKLLYARFFNHNDFVTFMPINLGFTKRGARYRHVGVGIKIPHVPIVMGKCRKWNPSVFYIGRENFFRSVWSGARRNFVFHLPWLWTIARMHTLAELLQRIQDGSVRRSKASDYDLLHETIEVLYEKLAGYPEGKTATAQG